jgi:hypothetical protein
VELRARSCDLTFWLCPEANRGGGVSTSFDPCASCESDVLRRAVLGIEGTVGQFRGYFSHVDILSMRCSSE